MRFLAMPFHKTCDGIPAVIPSLALSVIRNISPVFTFVYFI